MTAPPVRALLTARALTGEWVLDPHMASMNNTLAIHAVFIRQ
jgi:hypothetical protein